MIFDFLIVFTGIITAIGKVQSSRESAGGLVMTIVTPPRWDIKSGDSVATDGVCLTVARVKDKMYEVELMEETLRKSTFGMKVPNKVNLEQSLTLRDRLDGHLVLGHVDCVGTIEKVAKKKASTLYSISYPKVFARFVAPKGSVAVDGISLTVVDARPGRFTVSLVDYSLKHTTLGTKQKDDIVNLEFDVLAKYVAGNLTLIDKRGH